MSVYLMAGINIRDAAAYEAYEREAMDSLKKYDSEVLVVSDKPVAREVTNPFRRYVVLRFADQAAFDAWYGSPEYQKAIPLRHASAETGFFVTVEGM